MAQNGSQKAPAMEWSTGPRLFSLCKRLATAMRSFTSREYTSDKLSIAISPKAQVTIAPLAEELKFLQPGQEQTYVVKVALTEE